MPNANGYLLLSDLRKLMNELKDQPDDLEVGVTDHYGDFVPMSIAPAIEKVRDQYGHMRGGPKKERLVFERMDVGPEPD